MSEVSLYMYSTDYTCADIEGLAEIENCLFPVSGCVLGSGA